MCGLDPVVISKLDGVPPEAERGIVARAEVHKLFLKVVIRAHIPIQTNEASYWLEEPASGDKARLSIKWMDDASITIARSSPDDVKQRQIIVKLDGEPFAELLYGRTVTRKIPPGRHKLKVDNT